jgi:hypothetical protein
MFTLLKIKNKKLKKNFSLKVEIHKRNKKVELNLNLVKSPV